MLTQLLHSEATNNNYYCQIIAVPLRTVEQLNTQEETRVDQFCSYERLLSTCKPYIKVTKKLDQF